MDEIRQVLKDLSINTGKLTKGQIELVKGLNSYYSRYKALSEKQKKALFAVNDSFKDRTDAGKQQPVYDRDSSILFLIGYIRLRLKRMRDKSVAQVQEKIPLLAITGPVSNKLSDRDNQFLIVKTTPQNLIQEFIVSDWNSDNLQV